MYQPQAEPVSLNFPEWEHGTVEKVFNCTLDREKAEQSGWSITWLCGVKRRLLEEDPGYPQPIQLGVDLADRFLSNRLSLDPCSPTEDPELLTVLLHLPRSETSLGYLVGCWKRIQGIRMQLLRQPLQSADLRRATEILDKLHGLVISYAGLTLQDSSMFPQPEGVTLGPQELVRNLLSLRTVPLHAGTSTLGLGSGDAEAFLGDLAKRFLNNGLDEIFGPIITMVVGALPAGGLGSTGLEWRAVVGALEALVSDTNVAAVFPLLEKWLPEGVAPYQIEFDSLLGPLARMSIFDKEWPTLIRAYYSDLDKRTTENGAVETTLRTALVNLRESLFLIFNAILRTSGDARERVLEYFFTVLNINVKRAGDHVDPTTVASDGFMINLQAVMLRFAESLLDGKYSKIDHVDTKYFPMVTGANVAEETRINATAEEANAWKMRLIETGATPKNFISDIFFLCAGYNHLGIVRTIITHGKITKHLGEIDKWLKTAGSAETPSGHQHTLHQGLIERAKANQTRYQRELLACELQLQDPDITQRNLAFINYTMVWMLRMVDPTHQYPSKAMTLPLPERVPDEFNMLPEYFVEDTVEYYIYVMKHCPELLDNSLRTEFLVFALTFLTSTWYIKNPLLKSKLLQGLFYGSIHVGHEHDRLLIALFNSHPLALQHLIPSLMWFYVEVGQTSTNTQFESKRNITFILRLIWNNPNHHNTLLKAAENSDKFARFAVLLTHDTTNLLEGLFTKITSIKKYQLLIANKEQRDALSAEERSKMEEDFRQDEEMASSYATLGMSTVELLRNFTMETKATFLTPEIVNHLAAMLAYNIDMLCGPRCSLLQIKDMERYRFRPRQLLGELFQIFLNLSEDTPFVQAVANEGTNYKKDVFLKAAAIVHQRAIKSEIGIGKFVAFIQRVEHSKILIKQGNGLGDTAVGSKEIPMDVD